MFLFDTKQENVVRKGKSLDVSGPSFPFNKMNRCEASGEHEGSPPFLEAQIPNWSQPTLPISVLT